MENAVNQYMLTTNDNPYNPFTQFDQWFLYDVSKGYNTCAYLARIANTSQQLTDEENAIEIRNAIDEIIKYDFRNIYVRLEEATANDTIAKLMHDLNARNASDTHE